MAHLASFLLRSHFERSRPPFWVLLASVLMTCGAPKSGFSTLWKKNKTSLVSFQQVNENPTTDHLNTCFGASLRTNSDFSPILVPFALRFGTLWTSCWRPLAPKAPPARPKVPPELLLAPLWAPRVRPRRPQDPSDPAPATKTTSLASIGELFGTTWDNFGSTKRILERPTKTVGLAGRSKRDFGITLGTFGELFGTTCTEPTKSSAFEVPCFSPGPAECAERLNPPPPSGVQGVF